MLDHPFPVCVYKHHCCKAWSHVSPTSLLQGMVSCQPHIIAARHGLMSTPHHCCKAWSHVSPTSLLQGMGSCQPHIIAARYGLMSAPHHCCNARRGLMSDPHHCCKVRSHVSSTSLLQGMVSCQPHSMAICVLLFTITFSSSLPYSLVHTSHYHVTPHVHLHHSYITAFSPRQYHPPLSNHLVPLHHTSSPHVITTWITDYVTVCALELDVILQLSLNMSEISSQKSSTKDFEWNGKTLNSTILHNIIVHCENG